jgi:invasion protein IalB
MYRPRIAASLGLRSLGAAMSLAMLGASPASSALVQDAALPATKAGRLVGDWLKLCSAPNLEQLTNWLAENLSEEATKRAPAADRGQTTLRYALPTAVFA